MTNELKKRWARRRATGCVIALILIVYAILVTVFSLYVHLLRGWMLYLVPYAFLYLFLDAWFNPGILILALALVPMAGWILRVLGVKAGKFVIIASEALVLAMNVIVTVFHVILAFGFKDPNYAAISGLLSIPGVIVPCCILWAVHLWDPV